MPEIINAPDFDLAATLLCGQAFRWTRGADGWFTGVVGGEVWRLRQEGEKIFWEAARSRKAPHPDPLPASGERGIALRFPLPIRWGEGQGEGQARVIRYLSLDRSLPEIVATFPDDAVLQSAVRAHWGLRVLRQEPWETLASFIASSTKQIVQIRQIVAALAERFGDGVAFPSPAVIARATLAQLQACKLGFRAKYLLAAARAVDSGALRLAELPGMEYDRAREELQRLPGVGEKIAACVLLFGCGFDQAFPVDVWVERSLRRLYFPRRRRTVRQLREFARAHFGPCAGWAQQYLFYNERLYRAASLLECAS